MRALLLAMAFAASAAVAGAAEEPEGYRMSDYRAPVPDTLAGATVLTDTGVAQLWDGGGTGFIDVLPRPPKPANLPEGTVWHEKPRLSIPGAIWLPNTGYGDVAPETEAYLRAGLDAVTGGDPDHPVVFFCLAECWMSWNAAKRAVSWGYGGVHWYPEGTDGWAALGRPLDPVDPWTP